ncbi:hypothetical protein ASF21_10835 [Arthrobacter sp. Leaf234]|nr:hypothetical protein ASF21_10835 [Arthrobacter sp. Leaf234]
MGGEGPDGDVDAAHLKAGGLLDGGGDMPADFCRSRSDVRREAERYVEEDCDVLTAQVYRRLWSAVPAMSPANAEHSPTDTIEEWKFMGALGR